MNDKLATHSTGVVHQWWEGNGVATVSSPGEAVTQSLPETPVCILKSIVKGNFFFFFFKFERTKILFI